MIDVFIGWACGLLGGAYICLIAMAVLARNHDEGTEVTEDGPV